jgi:hypothetical protein
MSEEGVSNILSGSDGLTVVEALTDLDTGGRVNVTGQEGVDVVL